MAIQKEPGQKGASWSNIAVGTWALSTLPDYHHCLRALGAIMNMVQSYNSIFVVELTVS
jgi:hypothetical protein